jgi:hypothetical protein
MPALCSIRDSIRSEAGAALVLVALSVFALFAMIGLAIDSLNMLTAYRQSQFTGNMAALGAVEEFFANKDLPVQDRINLASDRARQILTSNPFFNQQFSAVNDAAQPDGLKLVAGEWRQPRVNGVPSGDPYFIEYTGSSGQAINSFRLSGKATQTTRLFIASNLFGGSGSRFDVEAIATVSPRRACFLVDLSSTVVTETYVDRTVADQTATPQNGRGAAYSFLLASDNPTVTGRNWHGASYWTVVDGAPVRASAPQAHQENPLIHFKDDYKFIGQFNDSDYTRNAGYTPVLSKLHPDPSTDARFAVGNARVYARADGFRDSAHLGPQPLRNIILGIRAVVEEFKSRRVYGDKVCLIFFDEATDWRRVVLPTDNFDYLLSLLSVGEPGGPALYADDRATVDANGLDPSAFTGHNLSARLGIAPQPSANTNLILPLALAQELLATDRLNQSGIPTTDFVVLATDGLSNCRPNATGYSCNDTWEYYRDSIKRIRDVVLPEYVKASIPIHVMLTGAVAGPHTLNMQKNESDATCASDSDARLTGRPYTAGIDPSKNYAGWYYEYNKQLSYPKKSGTSPFYYVNVDWYYVAAQSRGLWIPIRPMPADPSSCGDPETPRTCSAGTSWQLTDPYCRTPAEQTIDAAKKILGQNPYVIVKTMSDNHRTP